jgi:choline-sulfatase
VPIEIHSGAHHSCTAFKVNPHNTRARFWACLRSWLSVKRWASIALPCLFCVLLPLSATKSLASSNKAPSIVLISIDTLRADRLSCYGYRRVKTPSIDSITQGGTLFSAINSQFPLTFPSHVSLFTSSYPFFNGIEDNGEALRPNAVTLATVLKSRGYHTAAFVGGFVLDRRFGLNQGFDDYDSTFDLNREREPDPGDIKRLGADVVSSAAKWLEENSGRPFFVFIHLYDLHTPYNLPPSYRTRYGTGYDGELRYVDQQVGSIWDFLRRRGLFDHVLIVLTSDHGEGLGEHAEKTHGYFIYQSTLWVPLIVHWPVGTGSFPARSDEPASLIDVTPTILQFAGVAQPPEFQGRSLLELLRSGSPQTTREVYSESLYAHNHFGCSALRSLRTGSYKYIQAANPELYDLAADPGEKRNLYEQKRSVALASQQRLLSLRDRFRSGRPLGGKVLDPDTVARLRSLGYIALSSPHLDSPDTGADPKARIAAFEDYGRALVLASSGRVSESNALLEHLLDQYPELLDLRLSLGLNYQRLQRHEDATREFRQILQTDPLNTQAHFDLGLSLFRLHRTDDAVKELQTTLAIAPYYTRAEELLGTIWLQKGDYTRAGEQFTHLLTIDANDYTAHYNLGALAILQREWGAGEQHLRAALNEEPGDPDAHNTLGSLYLRKGDLDKAVAEFQEAIRLRPNFAAAHFNLGLAFRKQNRENEAVGEFRQAWAIDPRLRRAGDAPGSRRTSPNSPN